LIHSVARRGSGGTVRLTQCLYRVSSSTRARRLYLPSRAGLRWEVKKAECACQPDGSADQRELSMSIALGASRDARRKWIQSSRHEQTGRDLEIKLSASPVSDGEIPGGFANYYMACLPTHRSSTFTGYHV